MSNTEETMIEVGRIYRAQLGSDEADWCYVLTVARSTDAQGPVLICRRISLNPSTRWHSAD